MESVTNKSDGDLSFKDDEGKIIEIKAGESVECKYKTSQDSRLVIESKTKKKKGEL